jgi:ParB-like chromosome segregation protein Spo0J
MAGLMIPQTHAIADIYVPVKRRNTLDQAKVEELAESILENGLEAPILVRKDDSKGLVLVEGLHRLEACRALGEENIDCLLVQARQH